MRVIADLQIHSKYSMATSKDMDLEHLALGARKKGIDLLGTGDFTHPRWLQELRARLESTERSGVYSYMGVNWMLTGEVCTIYEQDGKTRKVHHLLYAPDFDAVEQINAALSRYGDLESDGRPVLTGIDSAELVEILTEVSSSAFVIPAHAWTPWFSVFGSKSGFDSLKDCYGDQSTKIFAIETGLSSDPPMNWRISFLDRVALISNSDAHSPHPWRLGREANVFELRRLEYAEVFDSIRSRDRNHFLFTIEVDPAYGKYHFTGHKRCGICLSPAEAIRLKGLCPRCRKKLTIGVLQRVEELADRPEGYTPPGSVPFKSLMSLYETIALATGVNRLYAKAVMAEQDRLINAFGSEFAVLLDAPERELNRVANPRVVAAILSMRKGKIKFKPGYDGKYGTPVF